MCMESKQLIGFIMLLLFVILLQHSLKYQKFILATKKKRQKNEQKRVKQKQQ